MAEHTFGFRTRALHAGGTPDAEHGARAVPIYQTSSFVFKDADDAANLFSLQKYGNIYSRLSNPTVAALEERIASLEGGIGAVATASGMAAAALVHVMGGTGEQMAHACAMALSNTLGLVCDPVAGLVEVPCVKRNVMGAVNALSCAEMALSGAESAIPCDEVIDAMRAVGDALPAALRETGGGGLAATPTGRRIAEGM